ncbi:MAG: DNA primase [Acidimicrobiia bacterium]
MGIVDEDVARVRDATNLRDIVSQYVQLKRVGRRWVGLCPFHAEKSGSFNLSEENGLWNCFGCQLGGDAIKFVREIEHVDFVGAIEWLAGKSGITLRYTERGEDEGRRRRARLVGAVGQAVDWYHDRLLTSPDAGAARRYLRQRGFDGDTVRRYRLGWAPEGWDEMARALPLPDDVLVDAGLGFLNRRGRPTDAFRGRVLFPIFDTAGDPVAFGGRLLPGAEGPKYKNSPENALYSKSRVLYGLNWSKSEIVRADEVVVCEGYTDVIGFAAAGVGRAVATCGTALTEEHLRLLKRFARRVVLAFDADAAGQNAAARFYQWERDLDLEVAVAALPEGVDPADLAARDPAALQRSVTDAVPFLRFRARRALAAADLSSPEGRVRGAEAALVMVNEHPNGLVRQQYLMEIAGFCKIDNHTVERLAESVRRGRSGAVRVREDRNPGRRSTNVWVPDTETELLLHAVHRRADVFACLPPGPAVAEVLFDDDRNLAAFRAVEATPSLQAALDGADPGAAERLLQVAVQDTDSDPVNVISMLVRRAATRAIDEDKATATEFTELKLTVEALEDHRTRQAAIDRLVTWLGSRNGDRA